MFQKGESLKVRFEMIISSECISSKRWPRVKSSFPFNLRPTVVLRGEQELICQTPIVPHTPNTLIDLI